MAAVEFVALLLYF